MDPMTGLVIQALLLAWLVIGEGVEDEVEEGTETVEVDVVTVVG
jgi:hypothetical protein